RDHTNLIAVTAIPVTTSVEAYNAYLQFLAIPGTLQATCTPPPEGAAHICRRYGKQYYWVPVEFKDLFFSLSLATSVERGRLLVPPPLFYSVTLQEIVGDPEQNAGQFRIMVQIDKELPNDTGRVEFSDGKSAAFRQYAPDESGLRVFTTTQLVV